MILTKKLLTGELMEVSTILLIDGVVFAKDPNTQEEIWYDVEFLAENSDIGGISTVIGETTEAQVIHRTGRFIGIRGRGLGRLLHFIEKYCEEDVVTRVASDWGPVPPTDDRYKKYVESLVEKLQADGFLTLGDGKLFAIYKWDGDTDIPTFEFYSRNSKSYRERQLCLKDQAIKVSEKAPGPQFEEEEISIRWIG